MIDPGTLLAYANVADLTSAVNGVFHVDYINWNGAMDMSWPDADLGTEYGNFQSTDAAPTDVADLTIPGIPGSGFDPRSGGWNGHAVDNFVAEIETYLQLKKGFYRMGVNSDDGFKCSVGHGPAEVSGQILGSFNGGRGADNTLFDFVVEADGHYAFRLLWWQGGGGANVEWFTVDPTTGVKLLINQSGQAAAVKAFRNGTGRAQVKTLLPADGFGGSPTDVTVKAELVDGTTKVVDGSATLSFDGKAVTPLVTKSGTLTTVTYGAGKQGFGSQHNAELTYVENTTPPSTHTVKWQFAVRTVSVYDLPNNSLSIQAEDFDYDSGQTNPRKGSPGEDVDVMPYYGGAYEGLDAVPNVDYHRAYEDGSSPQYRTLTQSNQPMDAQNDAGTLDVQRPGPDGVYDVTANYKLGWLGGGHWFNYTRTLKAGYYTAFAAHSYGGGSTADIATSVGGDLGLVTAGVGTTSQTLSTLGNLTGSGSGGWGQNVLVPMVTPLGEQGVFKLPGGKTTLRYTTSNGDFDWFVIVPVASAPPQITGVPQDTVKRNAVILDWAITDNSTKVDISSLKVFIDGVERTANATATKTATGATVHLDDSGNWYATGVHKWKLVFKDTGTPAKTTATEWPFLVNPMPTPGTFVIEAEDFNYDGGKSNPQAGMANQDVNVMPYLGSAYNGLTAVAGVDYASDDANDSDVYRLNESPNLDITGSDGNRFSNDRGTFGVVYNYRIGWSSTGDWMNYTRTFPTPARDYAVWAALSFDGRGAGQLLATLDKVTSDPTVGGQSTQGLGTFNAPGSAGWGRNDLVPLKDATGEVAKLNLGGTQTVRVTLNSGDFDFLLFVPQSGPAQLMSSPMLVDAVWDSLRRDRVALNWILEDFTTKVVPSSIKVTVDGKDVTAACTVTRTGTLTAVRWTPAAPPESGAHAWAISFSDDAAPPQTTSASSPFYVNPLSSEGSFVIEAEDFNYDSGKHQAAADAMPYVGGGYDGLSAVADVDYTSNHGNDSDVYRLGESPNVNINDNLGNRWGRDRGSWEVTTDYKVGWANNGVWLDYTRHFPKANYEVWAALSFDGRDPHQLRATLAKVTSDPTAGNQTTDALGLFDAPGSRGYGEGGWGRNELVPLADAVGDPRKTIALDGDTTLRMTLDSGDFDFLLFVPVKPTAQAKFTAWRVNTNGTITIEWTGGGTLQVAPTVLGPWTDVPGATSPLTFAASGKMQFGRIRQ